MAPLANAIVKTQVSPPSWVSTGMRALCGQSGNKMIQVPLRTCPLTLASVVTLDDGKDLRLALSSQFQYHLHSV